jgi:hypothetical protein
MVVRSYFNFTNNKQDQNLFNNLTKDFIESFGIDVYYIPRVDTNLNDVLKEDALQQYLGAFLIDVYQNTFNDLEGMGEFLSKFGAEIRDSITFSISKEKFEEEISTVIDRIRPYEGDIIYHPILKDYYQIDYVNHRKSLYPGGDVYYYELRCNKYDYSSELFDTGIPLIDQIVQKYSANTTLTSDPFTLDISEDFGTDESTNTINTFIINQQGVNPVTNNEVFVYSNTYSSNIINSDVDPEAINDDLYSDAQSLIVGANE